MIDTPDWLPAALNYGDFKGNYSYFLEQVYQIFVEDFINSIPHFQGSPLIYDSRLEDGKEAAFWHIICRDNAITKKRELDIRRCERIPWPCPIIEHSTRAVVSVWRNERKKTNLKRQTRILLWLESMNYIVVLAEKPRRIVFITAYCTDLKSQREKLRKERDEYRKKQKPPQKAT
jgi:hypothetical protein